MNRQATPHRPEVDEQRATVDRGRPPELREALRDQALRSALRKRAAGVPTYSVPEAAALMSISPEYLYRLIQADAFPAVHMSIRAAQGRYVVPAKAVDHLLDAAVSGSSCVESATAAEQWRNGATR